jgi:SAM-dependent methyltransferase
VSVHEVAVSGFGAGADAYERSRPTYPDGAVAWLVDALAIGPGATVADVAAGTGKFTRLLFNTGAALLAVEPVAGMRAQLAAALPGVPTIAGAAEALPLRDGSLDAITVAQAIHWFDPERALAEIHRVLQPGGRLGVIGNHRERSVPWVNAVWTIVDRVERDAPRGHEHSQHSVFVDQSWFTTPMRSEFPNTQTLSVDEVVDRIRSISHVAALPPDEQAALLDEVRSVVTAHPHTAGDAELLLPYRTDVCWARRVD